MKKTIFLFFFLILSCKKYLDTKPGDFVTPETFYKTSEQLNAGLVGVFAALTNANCYGSALYYELAIGNDEAYYRPTGSTNTTGVRVHNVFSSDGTVIRAWDNAYKAIERDNSLLDNIDASPADAAVKASVKGQALFLRGLYYFILVDNWGAVPLRLRGVQSPYETDFPRSSTSDVYAQIISDLKEAERLLPTAEQLGNQPGRPSKSAAQALLARVCLTMAGQPLMDVSKYEDAKEWASKVMGSGFHVLNPDYPQIFINEAQDKYDSKECIFEEEMNYDPTGARTNGTGQLGYVNGIGCGDQDTGFCSGQVGPTKKLFDMYADPNDKRRDWNVATYGYTSKVPSTRFYLSNSQIWDRWPGKWRRSYELATPKAKNVTGENFPVLRYADVLLMFAEAENALNGPTEPALNALNHVRARAGAKPFTADNLPTKTDFQNTIMDERMRELCFEGLRSHDLIRWGIFIPVMKELANNITTTAPNSFKFAALAGKNITPKDLLLPIPITEISLNSKATQNLGY